MNEIWGAIAVIGVFAIGHLGLGIWTIATLVSRVKVIEQNSTRYLELAEDHNERVIRLEEQAHARDSNTKEWHAKVENKFEAINRRLDNIVTEAKNGQN